MSYNLTLYVYLNVENGLLLCLYVQKVRNGQCANYCESKIKTAFKDKKKDFKMIKSSRINF